VKRRVSVGYFITESDIIRQVNYGGKHKTVRVGVGIQQCPIQELYTHKSPMSVMTPKHENV